MPEYLAPGVYVEEVDTGSKPIEGVSTSTTGMIGVTERGPVNVPILITSYGEFRRWFGDAVPATDFGDHSYLPHAVEGFFINGGKRLYLTRVIDTTLARRSAFSLFYDGVPGAGSTVLLRASAEFTGSAANPPPIVVLSGNNLAVNDWVRIGDGSGAEYRQIANIISPDTVVVPLHLPFARAHSNAAPIRQFTLGAVPGGAFSLVTAAAAGATTLNIEGAAADINALANDQLLRIDGALGEFRFIRGITNVADAAAGRRTARLTLDAPLALAHTGTMSAVVNTIERFTVPAAPPNPVQISPASVSGAAVVFVNNRGGAFNTRTDLVIADEGNVDRQEVRRIGELHQVSLGAGIPLGCGAGAVVNEVVLAPSDAARVQATPAPTATTFTVGDVTRLTLGQRVLIGPNATPRTVNSITPGAGNTGALAVTPALATAPAVGDSVVPVRQITAAAARGAPFLALDNRLGLLAGDVLRLTSGASEEYVVIDDVPSPGAPGVRPDAGNVLLDQPLSRDYTVATTEIVQLRVPITGPVLPDNTLQVQATPAPTTTTFGLNDVTRLTVGQILVLGSGAATAFLTIQNIAPGAGNAGIVTLTAPAAAAPAVGEAVVAIFPSPLPSDTLRILAAPAPTTTVFALNDVTRVSIGQFVLVGSGAAAAPRIITNVIGGTVTVTPALPAAPAAGDAVVLLVPSPLATSIPTVQAGPPPTITTFNLSDVTQLTPGQLVLVGAGGAAVPRTVTAIAPGAGSAGTVTVTPALAVAPGAGTNVAPLIPVVPACQSTVIAVGVTPGETRILLADGSGYTAGNRFVSIRTPEGEVSYHRIASLTATAVPVMIELANPMTRAHPLGSPVAERLQLLNVEALDAGAWGDRLRISVENEASGLASTQLSTVVVSPSQIRVASLTGIEAGSVLEMRSPDGVQVIGGLIKVQAVDRRTGIVTLQAPGLDLLQQAAIAALSAAQAVQLRSREFRLRAELLRRPDPIVPSRDTTVIQQEDFRHLSMDPRHSRYAPRLIGDIGGTLRLSDRRPEGDSWLIRVQDASNAAATQQAIRVGPESLVDILPDGRTRAARHPLSGGNDSIGTLTIGDYVGQNDPNPELRTGLQTLRNVEEISIVATPGNTSPAMQNALINHCEELRYRFAVLDGQPPPRDSMVDIQAQRQQFDTKYAALYHPWLMIPHPFPPRPGAVPDYPIPPSGHMLGVYARTDIERGVHKAPANEVVRGIIGLQRLLNKEQHDILNPYPVNINVIRDFRNNNRGIRVYGGRVITSDSDWKYVNVRRLLIFIEASIDRGLQWVVFEPNAEPLWARVRRSISNFLTLVWRNGGLEGTKVEEAFFVKCDRTTMTQTDIDSGRLIIVVGVAPVKPAEFVIVRIGLWTAHAED